MVKVQQQQIPSTLSDLSVPIAGLIPYQKNPRRGNTDVIVESLARHGQYRPIVVRAKTFEVLAGNHTLAAAQELGWTEIAATFVDVTDDEAARIVLVDNRAADLGTYDDEVLVELLGHLAEAEDGLHGSGYDDSYLANLTDILGALGQAEGDIDGEDSNRVLDPGAMLTLADVTFGEPRHQVHQHDVWEVGDHTLVVAHLQREHHLWSPYLGKDTLFAPYPDPYITCTSLEPGQTLLLVQPNHFLAGMLLDKHESTHPDDTVRRVDDGAT